MEAQGQPCPHGVRQDPLRCEVERGQRQGLRDRQASQGGREVSIVDFLYDFIAAWGLNMLLFAGPWILVFWGLFRLVEQVIKTNRLFKEGSQD